MSYKEEIYAHILYWKSSDLSTEEYCNLHGLHLQYFEYVIDAKSKEDTSAHFVKVSSPTSSPVIKESPVITIEYPNGVKLHLQDSSILSELIHIF